MVGYQNIYIYLFIILLSNKNKNDYKFDGHKEGGDACWWQKKASIKE